jgi:murein DD-endopeptidase MepM/ murein hydrolase activator NlpD
VSKVTDIVDRLRAGAGVGEQGGAPDREQVAKLAEQFESMLLVQMLRDMRESGKWDDETTEGGLGAENYFQTLDVELAAYISKAKGFGLADELLSSIEKTAGVATAKPAAGVAAPSIDAGGVSATAHQAAHGAQPAEGAGGPLRFAVAPGSITSSYGWRQDPFSGQARFHRGIDVRASYGQEIQAAGAGRVVFSGDQRGYGTTVLVEHANGVQTRYAHLSATIVQEGDTVAPGQVLGRAGKSGRATGTHLHFEVLKDGRHVSPVEAGLSAPAAD